MNRAEKAQAVTRLEHDLAASKNAILVGFAGLKVTDVTELRRQIRAAKSQYLVVKNTLALRATRGTPLEAMAEHFTGPTAVAYNVDNPVGLARVLATFAKTNPNLTFKGAIVEGRPVEAKQIQSIADLPSREELLGRLAFLLQSPALRLVTVLSGPVRNLAAAVAQIAEKKKASGAEGAAPVN